MKEESEEASLAVNQQPKGEAWPGFQAHLGDSPDVHLPPLELWSRRIFRGLDDRGGALIGSLTRLAPTKNRRSLIQFRLEEPGLFFGMDDFCWRLVDPNFLPGPGVDVWLWRGLCALGCGAGFTGKLSEQYVEAGLALGQVLALFSPMHRFLTGQGGMPTGADAESLIVSLGYKAPACLLLALAGGPYTEGRRRVVAAVLGRSDVSFVIRDVGEGLLNTLGSLLPAEPWLVFHLRKGLNALISSASVFSLLDEMGEKEGGGRPSSLSFEGLQQSTDRAVEALEMPGALTHSIERQRFSIAGWKGVDLSAAFFPQALVELALISAGRERRPFLRRLLAGLPAGPLRYFPNWRGIPPDVDSLGVALRLIVLLGETNGQAGTWLSYLDPNLYDEGLIHLWLKMGPAGKTTDEPAITWAGDDCTTSRLSLLLGLLTFDAKTHEKLIVTNLVWVIARLKVSRLQGTYYYLPEYGEALLLKCLNRAWQANFKVPGTPDPLALGRALTARWLCRQGSDGGLGSPQTTAWLLDAMCLFTEDTLALERAARYIAGHQGTDGFWPTEPAWRTVGKLGQEIWHEGAALTTAACLSALAAYRSKVT